MKPLRIEVPATSANLGPGFDTLGLALDIVDTIHVDFAEENQEVTLCEIKGDCVPAIDSRDNLLCRAYRFWSEDAGTPLVGARFSVESRIPMGKGFGSSAACIVAGLAAGAHASRAKDSHERRLFLAAKMEGHADNVAAATLGGLTTAFVDGERIHTMNVVNHLSLGVSLFVPVEPLPTEEARAALPRQVPMADAVFDLGRVSYLTTALIWGRWEDIGPAMQDRLHQPYRRQFIPALDGVIDAAIEAGAYGASLSGGGPSIIALGPAARAEIVAAAMESQAGELNWLGRGMVTRMRQTGVELKEEQPGE